MLNPQKLLLNPPKKYLKKCHGKDGTKRISQEIQCLPYAGSFFFFLQSGEAIWWRVEGWPRLVYEDKHTDINGQMEGRRCVYYRIILLWNPYLCPFVPLSLSGLVRVKEVIAWKRFIIWWGGYCPLQTPLRRTNNNKQYTKYCDI